MDALAAPRQRAPSGEETAHLAGNEAIAIRADVTDPDSLHAAIRATIDKFGRLDVLHNNAGGLSSLHEPFATPESTVVARAPSIRGRYPGMPAARWRNFVHQHRAFILPPQRVPGGR
ncbi:MAG: SDR family NAD(P)-dependent oxidoreductase [Stellaceae bacterium]